MSKHVVAVKKYQAPFDSVRETVELCDGLAKLPKGAKVVIKPNIVFWTTAVPFPKWGVITTSRVIEDIVKMLKDHGASEITIVEGSVTMNPKESAPTSEHAFESLGYNELGRRYGVKAHSIFARPFEKVDLGDGVVLNFNTDIINCDFVVDIPVMKTHAQTLVSLGIKNLKGTIDVVSRRACHSPDPQKDLHFWVARLSDKMPPLLNLIDGLYTAERGPSFDGRMHRSDLLVASTDIFSADKVGSTLLGHQPAEVPHLVHYAKNHGRPLDLSDVEVVGESDLSALAKPHEAVFPYTADGSLPLPMAKMGVTGLSYKKYDTTMCTYCSGINGIVLSSIAMAWKGQPWDDVEVLTGKTMEPTPGKKHTILLGKCIYQAHKDNPNIQHMVAIKSCPPKPEQIVEALHSVGVNVDENIFKNANKMPGFFMNRYKDKPEFEEAHFQVK
ncbi:protein of unknown function DUF362 [Desulfarculus baarsii DSM 2075]|uniref:DUF362 domain-containing protein n=1 Tax=Desulfarculus baarsii (strain ATCC 33931 / DSM 2075 / LMG 7858 / VKM B-1802 / 2st14) TaxID=644282 RepID=E1QHN1_DESB2|nr:DUF362 domain-containing protein [Desulfarculus baarsii]ADK85074.1 protein of unknown function DUF362 [Desulfarculus baarsii DSM 2075]